MAKTVWIALALLLACAVVPVVILVILSPGKPNPYRDDRGNTLPGSISEKIYVRINGVDQGMFIIGRDVGNPVLLYLHGGMPEYILTERYPTGLEDCFTVVWWEQRGAGISADAPFPPGVNPTEQLISDTLAVTDYVRDRFGKDKIYLLGHSGGTYIGIQAAHRAPDRFHAYIGVSQMSNQLRSEQLAHEYMLAEYRKTGNQDMVRRLEAAPVTAASGTPAAYLALRDEAMHPLGIGTTRAMKSVITGIVLPSLANRSYTALEKLRLWRAKARSGASPIWSDIIATDLADKIPDLRIPAYFLHGRFDYTCSYTEAKAYFGRLMAPVKGFYTFERSAHSPMFEEPERVCRILRQDVLTDTIKLADSQG